MEMKKRIHACAGSFSVPMAVVLAGASLLVVASVLDWSSSDTRFTQRQNQYFGSVAAAEASTEQVIASISRDFQSGGEPAVFNNLAAYRQLIGTVGSVVNTLTNLLGGGS